MPELKLTTEELAVTETLLDTSAEQSLELDFLLPDYEPEVFRILKTRVTPVIQQIQVDKNRLELSGVCNVSVLYLGERQDSLQAARQAAPFSKTLELKKLPDSDCAVQCVPRCYFVNARAVSSRRLEVRCGLSIRTRVTAQTKRPVVASAQGCGVQIHGKSVNSAQNRILASKTFTMSEDLELGQAKPAFGSLLDAWFSLVLTEKKMMENRVICKGDLVTRILYCPEGGGSPELMEWSEPVSQILDLTGVQQDDICEIHAERLNGSFEPVRGDGECRRLSAEWSVTISAVCDRNRETQLNDDAFSCQYASRPIIETVPLSLACGTVSQIVPVTGRMEIAQLENLCAILTSPGEYSSRSENGKLILSGTVEVSAIYLSGGSLAVSDKSILYEAVLDQDCPDEISFFPSVGIVSADGTLSAGGIDLRIQLNVCGTVCQPLEQRLLTGLEIDKDKALERSGAALRICYAEPGENLWDIAKRCRTSMPAIMQENDLQSETMTERQMLLIPMLQE